MPPPGTPTDIDVSGIAAVRGAYRRRDDLPQGNGYHRKMKVQTVGEPGKEKVIFADAPRGTFLNIRSFKVTYFVSLIRRSISANGRR